MKRNSEMKWGLLISSLYLISMITVAQPGQGKGPHHGGSNNRVPDSTRVRCIIDDLSKDLSLSAEQKQKVSAIQTAHYEKMKEVHKQDSICMAKNKEQQQQMRAEMDNDIKAVLNEGQKMKYDSIMTEKRGPHKGRPN
jgi:hypothetical protein